MNIISIVKGLIAVLIIGQLSVQAQWLTSGLADKYITAFAASGSSIFAGTQGDGIFRSTDNGANWDAVNTGVTNMFVNVLAVNASGNVFAGTFDGIFFTTNNGANWTEINTGLTETDINALIAVGTDLFAGAHAMSKGIVFRSTNNGGQWTEVNAPSTSSFYVNCFIVSGSKLFTGTRDGIYYTTNNGTNWTAVNTGLENTYVYSLATIGTNLFASTQAFVFRSTNEGGNWSVLNTDLPYEFTYSLAVNNTALFAGTNGDVYHSANAGALWTKVTTGMTNPRVNALHVLGTNLFAGTSNGVWRRPLSEMVTSIDEQTIQTPRRYALQQNYPNPFNPSTTIRVTVPEKSTVRIQVLNMLGQVVAVPFNGLKEAGSYELTFTADGLSSGVYLYCIEAAPVQNVFTVFRKTKTMQLVK